MASLRDVLNHAGKRVRLTSAGESREGLALRRGDLVLLDPRLEPREGETLEFLETGETFVLGVPEPQEGQGKIDHYRARLASIPRG